MMRLRMNHARTRAATGRTSRALACVATVLCTAAASAQGTLSGLGFGYPVGGTSTRASGTAGSFGQFDVLSPVNAASLGALPRTLITVQTEPEFRTLRTGSSKERTTAERVPLLLVAFPANHGLGIAFSASTFLDRSYSTSTTGSFVLDGTTLSTADRNDVRGSIGDLRAAVGWRVNTKVRVGLGGHLFTGDNVVVRSRTFSDTLKFGNVLDSSRVTYFGKAVSVGGELQVVKGLAALASYRAGGSMESRIRDTIRTRGNVPDRLGVALRYDGIVGSTFAVGLEQQTWSKMRGLGSDLVQAHDATNWHVGAEVAGPKLRGTAMQLRLGYAKNQLPFGVDGRTVRESRISGGFGLPVAFERASIDMSLQRANRILQGSAASKESAWMLGFGIQVRP